VKAEPPKCARELERAIGVVFRQPVECGTQVVVVPLEPCGPLGLRVETIVVGLLGKRREERSLAPAQLLPLVPLPELLEGVSPMVSSMKNRVVADRLDEAVVDERAKIVELRTADLFGCLQWERARDLPDPPYASRFAAAASSSTAHQRSSSPTSRPRTGRSTS
jgi:hypothetical protein